MSPGSTLPDGEVDPMDISMILSSGAFNLQDGALVQMDIYMTLQKGFIAFDALPLILFRMDIYNP